MVKSKVALVLFSGGRDSSSVVVELVRSGYYVKLYTHQAGLPELTGPLGDSAPDIRHKELIKIFPQQVDSQRVMETNAYLIKKLAIEKTNRAHVVYPLALALAVHTHATLYCLKNNISTIASGYSGYQSTNDKYIEQRDDFVLLTRAFLKSYKISYLTPVIDKSELEIKDILEKSSISSNSLENKSIFNSVSFDKDKALEFWQASIPICKEFIKYKMSSHAKKK